MARRECVTREALERAIKARIALRHGIDSVALTAPIVVRQKPGGRGSREWDVDPTSVPSELDPAIRAAIADMADRFELCPAPPSRAN